MSDRDQLSQAGAEAAGEHARAEQRLSAAVEEQSRVRDERVGDERDRAGGATKEVDADAALRAADDQVLARERWLKAVDDHNY